MAALPNEGGGSKNVPRMINVSSHNPPPTTNRVDPFTLKEWYDIKAPSIFQVRSPGKTLVTRTKGTSECDTIHDRQ